MEIKLTDQEKKEMEKLYPPGYDGPPDPHMSIEPVIVDGVRTGPWRCTCCLAEGDPNDLLYGPGCTKKHDPCPTCGCAPVCAMDCGQKKGD